jgi:hypothetical protein
MCVCVCVFQYLHVDPDDGCLAMLKGHKRVRLFSYTHWAAVYPNALGCLGKTIQVCVCVCVYVC